MKEGSVDFWKWLAKNVVLAALFVLVLVIVVSALLSAITRHGKEITVPDFSNMSLWEAQKVASASGLELYVKDSVYIRSLKRGVVYDQSPKPGSHVKEGRKIEITRNTVLEQHVKMPNLVGFSLRQARAQLIRNGLKLRKIEYVPDIATNVVLHQNYNGSPIKAGTMIGSGVAIDLVVGKNAEEGMTPVPEVQGRTYQRAVDLLQDNSLNVGNVRFDSTVKTYADSLNAFVYSQFPTSDSEYVEMGSEVSLSLTVDDAKRTF